MTHLTTEELAFFVDDDLDDLRRRVVAEHLASCPACARLVDEYRMTQAAIAAAAAAVPPLRSGYAPGRRRWMGAVAAAVILGIALLVVGAPAMAELMGTIIRYVSPEVFRLEAEKLRSRPVWPVDTREITPVEAAEILGRPLVAPGYIPKGFRLYAITVQTAGAQPVAVGQWFIREGENQPTLSVDEFPGDPAGPKEILSAGDARYITVNGQRALLLEGRFDLDEQGQWPGKWRTELQTLLIVAHRGHLVRVGTWQMASPKVPTKELIRIAEGLK